ncbi:MAG: alpha/beta hydrolase [Pseudomonadota bacterium]|nr:alpha/beta hydrolase [Pseudomonadota bacterium]
MHVLEAGDPGRPALLLLHGFPELAFSWRKVIGPLAAAGYHVIAPDQRGYGRTTGWDSGYDTDLRPFRLLNLVRDALALASALGHRSVAAVIGHDFGAPVAAACALARPDVFRSVALMSAPFTGPPTLPFNAGARPSAPDPIHHALAQLDPPRKHYQWYYSTRSANGDMWRAPQGVHAFLRAYYHYKSADWPGNVPSPLQSWSAAELARMPSYYIMPAAEGMASVVAPHMPSPEAIARCAWLTEDELATYAGEFGRTGFGGGLHWYRCRTEGINADLDLFSGRTIDVPSVFIAGSSDWGPYQTPGALGRMQSQACTRMTGCHLVPGAGHWVQQEQPEQVTALLLRFLRPGRDDRGERSCSIPSAPSRT